MTSRTSRSGTLWRRDPTPGSSSAFDSKNIPEIAWISETNSQSIANNRGMIYGTYTDTATSIEDIRAAFSELTPVRDDYPLLPIERGFNWSECADGISTLSLYLVVFRSVRRADADLEVLRAYDDRAYEDASRAPGFIHYFKGQVTPERVCLSFCLWRSREEARAASSRRAHSEAAGLVARMYESYELERHMLHQRQGMLVFEQLSG